MKIRNVITTNGVSFIILSTFLLCGIILGSVTASYVEEDTASKLGMSLESILNSPNDTQTILPQTLWNTLKYPTIVFLLGFTVLGVGIIPSVLVYKGFTTAFSIGVILKMYGMSGIWLSLSAFGIQILILLPCILTIACQSFNASRSQAKILCGKKHGFQSRIFTKKHFLAFGICLMVLAALVILELFISPKLIAFSLSRL